MATEASLHFKKLTDAGKPVGEVIAINSFLVSVKGLQPVSGHSVVMFEDGTHGFTRDILEDRVTILRMGNSQLKIGSLVVVQDEDLTAKVGKDFIGRVVSVRGEPLDGKGAIAADADWPVFNRAPLIAERELLDTQLETGVTLIDTLFPIVRGQRMALMGESKSGRSTLATQIALNQKKTDQVVVHVLIAKRRSDIDTLLARLSETGAMEKSIVVVSTIFESLVNSYLAPYVGCAMAEYLWQKAGQDVVIIYNDLTTHAQLYREISLLLGSAPGRDSYPGDIFHAHSSLLERAGKLSANHKALTAIPLVLVEGSDISAYLPTNIMAITDGQWILSMDMFRRGHRPAIDTGLSVTRVGGVGQNPRQKKQGSAVLKLLAEYARVSEYARFGAELSPASQQLIKRGQQFEAMFTQAPTEIHPLLAQQLMVEVLLSPDSPSEINIESLKQNADSLGGQIASENDYQTNLAKLKAAISRPPEAAK